MISKRKIKWIAFGVVLLGIVSYPIYTSYMSKKQVKSFRTVPVERGDVVQTVSATGGLQAVTQVSVGSQVSGRIQSIFVGYNSIVKKGQLIAQIDPSNYATQVTPGQGWFGSGQGG